jgi:hypothetical protein
MTIDELELERITQEVMEYVSRYLALSVDYDEWLKEINQYDFKTYIKEVIKTGVFTFGRDDSFIAPMYKSFVLGLRIARGVL